MEKTIFILLFSLVTLTTTQAQKSNYFRISGDAGIVVNTERDNKSGMGGTLGWLAQDNLFSFNPNNYISLSIKGFNNPYGGGKLVGSILKMMDSITSCHYLVIALPNKVLLMVFSRNLV